MDMSALTAKHPPPDIIDPSAVKIWGTKGIHFWALLGAILVKARPTSVLEFGSGRSTTFLADYAVRHQAPFVAIEQSAVWHRKAMSDLRFMDVRGEHVHHVPVVKQPDGSSWYDCGKVEDLIAGRAFDLAFIDGPVGDTRKNARGRAIVAEAARESRLIILDDVHRDYNLAFFKDLTRRFPRRGIFYYKYGKNIIAIGSDEFAPVVQESFKFLRLKSLAEL